MRSETPLIHPNTGKINIGRLASEITAIRDRLIHERSRLQTEHPYLKPGIDARLTCFSKYENVLNSFQLGCVFWDTCLLSPDWWDKTTNYLEGDRQHLRGQFQVFLKLGLVHSSFSAIESSLRVFMRAVDTTAHAGGTVEFKRIYDDLLANRLSRSMPDFVDLLDMFAKLRNTVHNNGVYFHRSGNDALQNYRGKTYVFCHGNRVDFADWPLLLKVLSDLASMLTDIVHDWRIIVLTGDILDPGS